MNPLALAARHGPMVLVGGLLLGLFAPPLADAMRPFTREMVILLLFVSVLRMEPSSVLGSLGKLPTVALTVAVLQFGLPMLILCTAFITGWQHSPIVLALVLMTAAPSIVGSPNISMMMGVQPGVAMRLMVTGTLLLPLTVTPILSLLPTIEDSRTVIFAALRLLATVVVVSLAAMATRRALFPKPSANTLRSMEGASALALSAFVIGLMPAVREVALTSPTTLIFWLAIACAANLGLQTLTYRATRDRLPRDEAVSMSIISGNRNIALFLISLPLAVTEPIMVFIGCYQIPMYLTPMLMRRLYRPSNHGV